MEILLYKTPDELSAWSYVKYMKRDKLNISPQKIFEVIETPKKDILTLLGDSGCVVLSNIDAQRVFEKYPELLL